MRYHELHQQACRLYLQNKPYDAFDLFQAAHKGEHSATKVMLGAMYLFGHGTGENTNKAVELLKQAVSQGNMDAVLLLANIYLHGTRNIPVSYQNFFSLLRPYENKIIGLRAIISSSRYIDSEIAFLLGVAYKYGYGTQLNEKKADKYFRYIMEHNYTPEQIFKQFAGDPYNRQYFYVAMIYQFGTPQISVDIQKAIEYYKKVKTNANNSLICNIIQGLEQRCYKAESHDMEVSDSATVREPLLINHQTPTGSRNAAVTRVPHVGCTGYVRFTERVANIVTSSLKHS